jgi:hypothetical protein
MIKQAFSGLRKGTFFNYSEWFAWPEFVFATPANPLKTK